MATSSSLIKSLLHKSIAEGVYKEILSNSSRYYYFLGKTLSWSDEASPPYPTDSLAYERDTRNNIITFKQIQQNDVAFIVPRIDWKSGNVYDIYDDQYSTSVLGVNITAGGTNYLVAPTVTIDPPDLPNGIQATAVANLYNTSIGSITMVNNGSGYTNHPNVTFTAAQGSGAAAVGVIGMSATGAASIEQSQFYVMTDEYNVYKCLDNNNEALSTAKPIGSQVLPISMSDGYVWKYMFNVPLALRTKFLNDEYFPIVTALSQQFYSNGGIEAVKINSRGTGYSAMTLNVDGDGYLASDPVYLGSVNLFTRGYGYTDGDTISIVPPYTADAYWTASSAVFLGSIVSTSTGKLYNVVQAGTTGVSEPSFRSGTVSDGTCALEFIGETAKAYPSFNSFTVAGTIAITGTAGQFSCDASSLVVGDTIKVTGTKGGTSTFTGYLTGNIYKVSAVTGTSPNVTAFTLTTTTGAALSTVAGTLTGLTFSSGAITAVNTVGGIREITLNSFGSGYTSNPTINFTAPTITFTATATYVNTTTEVITIGSHWFATGDKVVYSTGGGTAITGLVNNTNYYIIKSSSTAVKLASSYANATAGTAINLTAAGVGTAHTLANALDLPTASAVLSSTGVVQRIKITDSGANFPTAPTVTIGTALPLSTAVTLGQQYFVSSKLYTVTTAGTTAASNPTTTALGDIVTSGTAALQWVGSAATGSAVLRYGYGYSGNPTISITTTTGTGFSASFQSTKTNAKLIPQLENGQLVGVQIDDPGIGYSSASISVTGDGTGCSVAPDISLGNINSLQANNELLTVAGTINNIQVVSGGYGYGVATISIAGDGTGATATATVSNGALQKITITNQGQGYTYADITITGNGTAASARAIISPHNGHGKDSFDELYANTLMFYSNVSRDKNQGFDVNNDYRQVGILKNPRYYNATTRYSEPLGSGCFTISATFSTVNFVKDMILTIPRTVDSNAELKRYYVVSVNSTGTSMLVQSIDGDTPLVGDQMTNINSQFFSVAAVGNPTVDKYSGDILFIDNKAGFTPSAQETVTLRTIITF